MTPRPDAYAKFFVSLSRGLAPGPRSTAFTLPAALLLAVLTAPCLYAPALDAQRLPPTPPTVNTLPAPIAASPLQTGASSTQPHRAQVAYSGGLLSIRANDSSLNGILRSVSRLTGMKIVGGVAEERVFGTYGPAAPATVLVTLLDGTGSNMVLRETASDGPAELILSRRTGGSPLPSPFTYADIPDEAPPAAAAYSQPEATPVAAQPVATTTSRAAQPPPSPGPPSIPQPWNNVNGSASNTSPTASTLPTAHSVPLDSIPTPSTTPSTRGVVDAPNPPPAGTYNPLLPNATPSGTAGSAPGNAAPTPNNTGSPATTPPAGTSAPGTKTPQQIYQELQQLEKQSSQPQPNAKPNAAPTTSPASTTPQQQP